MDASTDNVQNAQSQNLHVINEKDARGCLSYNGIEEVGERSGPYGDGQETNVEFGDQSHLDVDFSLTPHVGMEFPTDDAAYAFYNEFSLKKGFSIRKYATYKSRTDDEISKRIFVCNKEGYKRMNDRRQEGRNVTRRRDEREGCKARLNIHRIKNGVWVIKAFDDIHNHPLVLSPRKKKKLRSHNKAHTDPSCKALIDQYHSCGIGPSKISRLINTSGNSSVQITPQQCVEHLRTIRKNNMGKECTIIAQKFLERQANDSQFYYAIEIDENQVCRSIFWADGRARTSYMQFSDVIVFDVTYRTNNFKMPFAPFTGVNHHRQSVLFGCALLADEREESFIWLFKQWLKCMWNKAPGAIITDQDPAIRNAIEKVFPNTCHRFCSWHLSLHEDEHLRSLRCAYDPCFYEDYKMWIKKSRTIEESEKSWDTLKERYKQCYDDPLTEVQRNKVKAWRWLESMYDQRHHWVKAYLKHTFFAGMKSSQRSESMNAFFDGFVNSTTPLNEFVSQYDKAVADRRNKEENEDLTTMRTRPTDFMELSPIEANAGMVYTRNMFKIFQEEFRCVFYCRHKKVKKEGNIAIYDVFYKFKNRDVCHAVEVDYVHMDLKCTCSKFESAGILCKHILYIMKQKLDMNSVPDKYILTRWTLKVRHATCVDHQVFETNNEQIGREVSALEVWNLRTSLNKMCDKLVYHKKMFESVKETVKGIWKQIEVVENEEQSHIHERCSQAASCISPSLQATTSTQISIRDPTKVRTKGRPPASSRIPSGIQVAQNRTRTCSLCNGKGHDMRTCKIKSLSEIDSTNQ